MIFIRQFGVRIVFLLIGLILGIFIPMIPFLNFDNSINPIDVVNVVVTLILAITVAFFIEPMNEQTRAEKELLIEQLKEVKAESKSLHDNIISAYRQIPLLSQERFQILASLRSLSNQLYLFLDQA